MVGEKNPRKKEEGKRSVTRVSSRTYMYICVLRVVIVSEGCFASFVFETLIGFEVFNKSILWTL